jgi:hypothetical protein
MGHAVAVLRQIGQQGNPNLPQMGGTSGTFGLGSGLAQRGKNDGYQQSKNSHHGKKFY